METNDLEATNEKQTPKRPLLVWIITIFLIWSALSAIFTDLAGIAAQTPPDAVIQHRIPSLAWLDHVFTLGLNTLLLISTVSLFRLQSKSLFLFLAYILGVFVIQVWHLLTTDWFYRYGIGGILAFSFGIGIFLLITLYIFYLRRQGRLS